MLIYFKIVKFLYSKFFPLWQLRAQRGKNFSLETIEVAYQNLVLSLYWCKLFNTIFITIKVKFDGSKFSIKKFKPI